MQVTSLPCMIHGVTWASRLWIAGFFIERQVMKKQVWLTDTELRLNLAALDAFHEGVTNAIRGGNIVERKGLAFVATEVNALKEKMARALSGKIK